MAEYTAVPATETDGVQTPSEVKPKIAVLPVPQALTVPDEHEDPAGQYVQYALACPATVE